MKLSLSAISIMLAVCQFAVAVPANPILNRDSESSSLVARQDDPPLLQYCVEGNFGEPCNVAPIDNDKCGSISSPYRNNIKSVGIIGSAVCTFFSGPNCFGGVYIVPGKVDNVPPPFENDFTSFRCLVSRGL